MGFVQKKNNTNALSHPPSLSNERMPSETYVCHQKSLSTIDEALNSDKSGTSENVSSHHRRTSTQVSQESGTSSAACKSSASSSQSSGMFPGTSYGDQQNDVHRSFNDNNSCVQQSVEYSMNQVEDSPNSFVRKAIETDQEVLRKEEYLKKEQLAQKDQDARRTNDAVKSAMPRNDFLMNELEEKLAACCDYLQKGDYDTSLRHFNQLLRSHPKKATPLLASTYHNLGILWTKRGSQPQALKNFHKSIIVHRDVFGENHPMLAMTFVQLGFFPFREHQRLSKECAGVS